jgi:hypothetical protein
MAVITIAVEGIVDSVVAQRICRELGHEVGPIHIKNGKRNLDPKITAYNHAATRARWLVLRDLDFDADCPATLRGRLLPTEAPGMRLRIAVRAVESWLLADQGEIASYLGIRAQAVPEKPDSLDNPKQDLVNLARLSPRRLIREDMVPEEGARALVGPGYTQRVIEFVQGRWEPRRAAQRSASLARCLRAL